MSNSALRDAIDKAVTPELKPKLMPVLRAVVITAMQNALLETDGKQSDTEMAANARCYARLLKEIDVETEHEKQAVVRARDPVQVHLTPAQMAEKKRQMQGNQPPV